MRELIEVTLEDAGDAVESVESGRAALERLAQQAYDLVVFETARRYTGRSRDDHHLGRRSCSSPATPRAAPTRSSSGPRRRR
jgi:hypothetical protein